MRGVAGLYGTMYARANLALSILHFGAFIVIVSLCVTTLPLAYDVCATYQPGLHLNTKVYNLQISLKSFLSRVKAFFAFARPSQPLPLKKQKYAIIIMTSSTDPFAEVFYIEVYANNVCFLT